MKDWHVLVLALVIISAGEDISGDELMSAVFGILSAVVFVVASRSEKP